MKKRERIITLVIIGVVLISLIASSLITGYASKHKTETSSSGSSPTSSSPVSSDSSTSGPSESGSEEKKVKTEEIHTFLSEKGNPIQITTITETKTKSGEVIQKIKIRDVEAISSLGLEQHQEKVEAKLSNGKNSEVKIMPDTASAIALAKLRSQDRTLELKQVGEGNDLSVVYVSEANKTTKFLGLFKVRYNLVAIIDPKTGEVIKLNKPWWFFLTDKEIEEPEIANMSLQLIKPIQDIILIKNTEKTLDLDEYFLNAESYSISEISSITSKLGGSLLTLTPEINYIGTTSAIITAHNGEEKLDASFNIIVSEENLSVQTFQYPAILGERVKWEKRIKTQNNGKIDLKLPESAEDISITELDENETAVNNQKAKNVEIQAKKGTSSYKVEYYTSRPYTIKKQISDTRKEITIIGNEKVHYTNVLAFESLRTETNADRINLYQITEKGKIEVKIEKYDTNKNNLIDYIEWIVPSLSDQTYELIIEIAGAEHLDINRGFISDIYNEVYKLDNIWSETIPANDYVRATFKRKLSNTNDITVFPRIISGNPKIEIYEADKNEIIAEFTNLISNEYNKVYLTNLQDVQDIFDLKVLDGSIQLDYIVDPTVIALNSPANDTHSNNPVQNFLCSATDDWMLSNITLYGNWAGGWHANETKDVTGISDSASFTKTFLDGTYLWNCKVYDNDSNYAWYDSNYTLTIDTIFPLIDYTSDSTINYANLSQSNIYVKVSAIESDEDTITFSLYNQAGNLINQTSYTDSTRAINWTSLSDEVYTYNATINDTSGNSNTTLTRTVTLDNSAPVISFSCDKTSAYLQETISCSCSATDNIDSNPTVVYTTNPTTSQTGTFTTSCSVTDYTRNSMSSAISYIVEMYGKVTKPLLWKATYILTNKQFAFGYNQKMKIKERVKFFVNNKGYYFGLIDLTENSTIINVSSQQTTLELNNEKKFDVTGDDYYDLSLTLNSLTNNIAEIKILSVHEKISPQLEEKVEKESLWTWLKKFFTKN